MEPESEMTIKDKYELVHRQVEEAGQKQGRKVRLVAVSKTKTVKELQEAYNSGARVFGENYINELEQKHHQLPKDIQWHFIGHLQSNKIKKLLAVPNLSIVETIDRQSLADKLNSELQAQSRHLDIFIQIKTSDEESKSGVDRQNAIALIEHIVKSCSALRFKGLMTVGKEGDMTVFPQLCSLRDEVSTKLSIPASDIELSMGMSADFLKAIESGSTNVRVGSSIFGARFRANESVSAQKNKAVRISIPVPKPDI